MTTARAFAAVLLASTALIGCQQRTPAASAPAEAPAAAPAPPSAAGASFSRRTVGEAQVTTVHDGQLPGDFALFAGLDEAGQTRLYQAAGQAAPPAMDVQAFVVDVGGQRVLVDTGAGGSFGPGAGRLPANLAAAGVTPESVQHVVISHMHGDHIGGLLDDQGRPRFPNALIHVDAAEVGYWTDEGRAAEAPEFIRPFFAAAQAVTAAYGRRVRPFRGRTEIVPGFSAEPTHGHTPGHAFYRLVSGGRQIVFIGDLIHAAAVQFPRPDLAPAYDADADAGRAARVAALPGLVGETILVAGPHFPYPGIGRVQRVGEAYRWTPAAPEPAAP